MALRVRDPAKYVAKLDDDWEKWPAEAIIMLNEELDRLRLGVDVSSVFNLQLHAAQQQIIDEARRFNVADCGRRFGKSILGQRLIAETLLKGEPCSWMSPSYRSLGDAWRVSGVTDPGQLTRLLSQAGHYLTELTPIGTDLESVFLDLTNPDQRSSTARRTGVDQ